MSNVERLEDGVDLASWRNEHDRLSRRLNAAEAKLERIRAEIAAYDWAGDTVIDNIEAILDEEPSRD